MYCVVWIAQHDAIDSGVVEEALASSEAGNSCCISLPSVHSCVSGRQVDNPVTLSPPGRVKEQDWYEHACPGPHTAWVPRYPEVDGTQTMLSKGSGPSRRRCDHLGRSMITQVHDINGISVVGRAWLSVIPQPD